jgi:class 3 adenylate cyclase
MLIVDSQIHIWENAKMSGQDRQIPPVRRMTHSLKCARAASMAAYRLGLLGGRFPSACRLRWHGQMTMDVAIGDGPPLLMAGASTCRVDAIEGLSTMSGTKASDPIRRSAGDRKLIAVVHADVVGYSRLIGLDDVGTLERLRTLRRTLIDLAIDEYGGRIVNTGGDSLLVVFDSTDGAVRCAVKVQQQVRAHDRDQPSDRAIRFRVGINVGDVIPDGTDVHGEVVNVAARLQANVPRATSASRER